MPEFSVQCVRALVFRVPRVFDVPEELRSKRVCHWQTPELVLKTPAFYILRRQETFKQSQFLGSFLSAQ